CHPSSTKMTPRNISTITMARRGSPVESGTRSFIEPHCSESGHLEAEAPRRAGLLAAGTEPSQPLHQHGVGGQRLGPVDQRVEHLVVARRRHREELLDGVFLHPGVLPPLAFERQDVVFAAGEPIGDFRVVPRSISPRHGAVHIASPGPFRRFSKYSNDLTYI